MQPSRTILSIAKFENWPNDDLFSIQQVVEEASANYRVVRNNAEAYLLLYVSSGRLIVNQNGIVRTAQPGDTVLLKRHTAHLYYSAGKTPLRILHTTVCGSLCDMLYDALHLQKEYIYRQADCSGQLRAMLDYALRPLPVEQRVAYCCGRLTEAFYILHQSDIKTLLTAEHKRTGRTGAHFIKVVIDRHLDTFYSNAELAALMKCSISTMVKNFQSEYGFTPMAYQARTKITAVKQQLENPNLSIKEISHQLGFCDPSYLSSYFKKHAGITARAYRLQKRNETGK